jgi:Transposase IS116/IS110/IS902 family
MKRLVKLPTPVRESDPVPGHTSSERAPPSRPAKERARELPGGHSTGIAPRAAVRIGDAPVDTCRGDMLPSERRRAAIRFDPPTPMSVHRPIVRIGHDHVTAPTGELSPAQRRSGPKRRRKAGSHTPQFDLGRELHRISGVDLTRIDGIDVGVAQTVISEIGLDMTRWKTEAHFASWLGWACVRIIASREAR